MPIHKISSLLIIILALSFTGTFFGKSLIGIIMGIAVLLSAVMLCVEGRHIWSEKSRTFRSFFINKEIIAIAGMVFIWLLSSVFARDVPPALETWAEVTGMIVGGGIIFAGISRHSFNFDLFFKICAVTAAFYAFYLVATPFIRGVLPVVDWGSSYGSVLAMVVPFILSLLFIAKDSKQTILWGAILFIVTAAIFASGGRTAWVCLIVICLCFPFLFPWTDIMYRKFKFMLVIGMLIIGAVAGLYSYKQNVGDQIYELRTGAMSNMERPASGRLIVWKNTLPHIEDNLLLGVGMKGSKALNIDKGGDALVAHVHNAVLEINSKNSIFTIFITVFSLFVATFWVGLVFRRHLSKRSLLLLASDPF